SLVDRSLWHELGDFKPTGVNERLARKVRDVLDRDGFEQVKIVVSGGFTIDKIREFEQKQVPVDAYGVGSSLIRGSNDFTADFMLPGGKLYVPGAETTVPGMKRLVEAVRGAGLVHVASADDHELIDDEISDQPDFQRTYPAHCLRGTRGARKIPETEQEDPVPITLTAMPERYLEGREFLLLKKSFDVFTNPNTDRLLERLDPDEIVLFGVATDVCDDAAI